MLTLLYGTRAARDEIFSLIAKDVADGRRAYLIVPDQKALLAENALMNYLPKSAALLVDAVGFSRLANLVSRRYGALTYQYANDGAKSLTMYRAIKKLTPYLHVFGGEMQSGTLDALCSLMGEFRACSIKSNDLDLAANALGDSPLAEKLRDLALIYTEYETILHERFCEQADDIDTLCDLLAENDFFGDSHVYIDSFISFTKQETTVLSHILSRGSNVTLALPFSRVGAHMAECADTRKKLLSLCAKLSVEVEEKYTYSNDPEPLEFAKENLWDLSCEDKFEGSTKGCLELYKCADKNEEVSLCLGEIFKALQNGNSYSDIAIIARNAENYSGTLDRALDRCGIPFFFSKKSSAELLPLTRLILSALSLYVYNFKQSDVAAYIKTGLVGLSDDECDVFEEYTDRWNICGRHRYLDGDDFTMSGQGYTAEVTDMATLEEINEIKRKIASPLSRLCDSLDGARTVRDFSTAIYEYLSETEIREKSADANFVKFFGTDKSADAIRLWNMTMEALDTMVEAAGDEETTASDFCTLVRLLFSSIDIAEIPSSKDQIIIGSADTIRIDERKIVLIIGANEGIFPAPVSESPTLCESERNALKEVGVTLSQNLRLRSARELYHFVRSIDFATDKAVISYYLSDIDGSKREPSFAISRLKKLFPALEKCSYTALALTDRVFYPTSAADAIGVYGDEAEKVLKATLSEKGMYTPPIKDVTALGNAYSAISSDIAKDIYGDSMRLSQSKIDTYSDCRLRHFMQYIINLEDTAPFEFNPANTGTFVHSVLENFLGAVKSGGKRIADLEEDEIEMLASTLCAAETEKIMRSAAGKNARMLCFFDRMKRSIILILRSLVNEFKNSSFEPFLLEYRIGSGGHKPLSVTLPDGAEVSLNGIADRIDICKQDGKVFLRVSDYKTGKKPFSEADLKKGKNLQLLIYLFSLCYVADKHFFDLVGVDKTDDIVPASVTYFVVKPPKISLDTPPTEDITPDAESALERKGFIFDAEAIAGMIDRTADKKFIKKLIEKSGDEVSALFDTVKESITNVACDMRAGKIDTYDTATGPMAPCRYCAYARICRKEDLKGEDGNG
ncbi:MAG: PD-(D/E)XK nuclease family protein [Clostridia bacterium]|nr:PD-(D/E)XK nuclease family protein [Clostridia bacterium]